MREELKQFNEKVEFDLAKRWAEPRAMLQKGLDSIRAKMDADDELEVWYSPTIVKWREFYKDAMKNRDTISHLPQNDGKESKIELKYIEEFKEHYDNFYNWARIKFYSDSKVKVSHVGSIQTKNDKNTDFYVTNNHYGIAGRQEGILAGNGKKIIINLFNDKNHKPFDSKYEIIDSHKVEQNCTLQTIRRESDGKEFEYIKVDGLQDSIDEQDAYLDTISKISDVLSKKHYDEVFVNCAAGISRSNVAAAFFKEVMRKESESPNRFHSMKETVYMRLRDIMSERKLFGEAYDDLQKHLEGKNSEERKKYKARAASYLNFSSGNETSIIVALEVADNARKLLKRIEQKRAELHNTAGASLNKSNVQAQPAAIRPSPSAHQNNSQANNAGSYATKVIRDLTMEGRKGEIDAIKRAFISKPIDKVFLERYFGAEALSDRKKFDALKKECEEAFKTYRQDGAIAAAIMPLNVSAQPPKTALTEIIERLAKEGNILEIQKIANCFKPRAEGQEESRLGRQFTPNGAPIRSLPYREYEKFEKEFLNATEKHCPNQRFF